MEITLQKIGKRFGKEWIFRDLDLQISSGDKIVILGGNGSGKSTLLQVISGYVSPAEGVLAYKKDGMVLPSEEISRYISFASPYLQLTEDLSAYELTEHVARYKPFLNSTSPREVVKIAQLERAGDKLIRQFSSGMKQRLKLALAILADSEVVLLDEPVSNLDKEAIAWYQHMVNTYLPSRTVIVCSNAIEEEYFFCTRKVNVHEYKPK